MLASDSEAIVKAEQAKPHSIKEMQEATVECIIEENKDMGGGSPGGNMQRH